MKFTKKKVLVVALAVCLIAVISSGSLAWFNATDSVTNTFKVATDDNVTDPDFSVKVSETDLSGNETEDGVTYYAVLPGDVINKDPKVTNTGDYSQWVRVSVTMTKADKWKNYGGSLKFTDLFAGAEYGSVADVANAQKTWLFENDEATVDANGNAVWYLYLNKELAPEKTETLFTTVKIAEDLTLEEVKSLGKEFNITVKADALQSKNTGDNAVAAFANVNWTAGTNFVDKD